MTQLTQHRQRNLPFSSCCLILAPTAELVQQIKEVVDTICAGMKDSCYPNFQTSFSQTLVTHLQGIKHQLAAIERNKPALVIGTPKALFEVMDLSQSSGDAVSKRHADQLFHSIQTLVLDEPDQILKPLGKYATKKELLKRIKKPKAGWLVAKHILEKSSSVQLVCASATINRTLKDTLQQAGFASPTRATIGDPFRIPHHISHKYLITDGKDKIPALLRLYRKYVHPKPALVIVEADTPMHNLLETMKQHDVHAVALHLALRDADAKQREKFMNEFRLGNIQMVFVTEDTARGLDFPALEYVIILTEPRDANSYIHLAGRTGRSLGIKGTTITVVTAQEAATLANISHCIQQELGRPTIKYIQIHFEKVLLTEPNKT